MAGRGMQEAAASMAEARTALQAARQHMAACVLEWQDMLEVLGLTLGAGTPEAVHLRLDAVMASQVNLTLPGPRGGRVTIPFVPDRVRDRADFGARVLAWIGNRHTPRVIRLPLLERLKAQTAMAAADWALLREAVERLDPEESGHLDPDLWRALAASGVPELAWTALWQGWMCASVPWDAIVADLLEGRLDVRAVAAATPPAQWAAWLDHPEAGVRERALRLLQLCLMPEPVPESVPGVTSAGAQAAGRRV